MYICSTKTPYRYDIMRSSGKMLAIYVGQDVSKLFLFIPYYYFNGIIFDMYNIIIVKKLLYFFNWKVYMDSFWFTP